MAKLPTAAVRLPLMAINSPRTATSNRLHTVIIGDRHFSDAGREIASPLTGKQLLAVDSGEVVEKIVAFTGERTIGKSRLVKPGVLSPTSARQICCATLNRSNASSTSVNL